MVVANSGCWREIPLTGGGQSLPDGAREYMRQLLAQQQADDPVSQRHHYVPQSYLRPWSADGRRIWTLDTTAAVVKLVGVKDVCVEENFYRVTGPDGLPHNRVELLFQVVDDESHRIQQLFTRLENPDVLEFDDLIGLGVTLAIQGMRTVQQRRLQLHLYAWMAAQKSTQVRSIDDDPFRLAGAHTQLLFYAMWKAADVFTSRQTEVWDDPLDRFMTCDVLVRIPFRRNVRPSLITAPVTFWPISPQRVVALSNDPQSRKAVMRQADGRLVGLVRRAVEEGRDRRIFCSEEQHDPLPQSKEFRRRAQNRIRCSSTTPDGRDSSARRLRTNVGSLRSSAGRRTVQARAFTSPHIG